MSARHHPRPIVHCLQHSERVRPLTVAEWADLRGVELRVVRVDEQPLPPAEEIERLVVLGGQMNTDETAAHPWLAPERELLARVIELGRARVLGICLGSQLLAEVLGGTVARAAVPEIGWQRVRLTDAGRASEVFRVLDDAGEQGAAWVFEWHGDAWTLPPAAQLTVTSDGCATQAFSWGDRVHAVQFHPEFTLERTRELAATTTDSYEGRGEHVQRPVVFLGPDAEARFTQLRELCLRLLDAALDLRA